MNLLTKSTLTMIAGVFLPIQTLPAFPDDPFYSQEESAQHFLYEKGKQFRLFHFNMSPYGEGAEFDEASGLTQWPSLRLHDQSESAHCFFFQKNPLWIKPCTGYSLIYQARIEKIAGPPPYIEIFHYDYNTDILYSQRYPIQVDKISADWITQEILFNTDHETYEIKVYIYSNVKGLSDVRLDKIYLTQTTGPGALKPDSIVLFTSGSVRMRDIAKKNTTLGKVPLPLSRTVYRINFDLTWESFDGNHDLFIDWIGNNDEIIGQDVCRIGTKKGVLPKWDAVTTRWNRHRGHFSDQASFGLDWHFNMTSPEGGAHVEKALQKPEGARSIHLHIQESPEYKGELNINNLILSADY